MEESCISDRLWASQPCSGPKLRRRPLKAQSCQPHPPWSWKRSPHLRVALLFLRLTIWEAGNEKFLFFFLTHTFFSSLASFTHYCSSSRIWNWALLFTFSWVPWGLIVDVCVSEWSAFWLQFLLQSQPRSPRSWPPPLPGNNRPFLQNTGLSSFSNTQDLVLWRRGLPDCTKCSLWSRGLPKQEKPTHRSDVQRSQGFTPNSNYRTQKVNYMPHQKANRYSHGSNRPGTTRLLTVQAWKSSWAARSKPYRDASTLSTCQFQNSFHAQFI